MKADHEDAKRFAEYVMADHDNTDGGKGAHNLAAAYKEKCAECSYLKDELGELNENIDNEAESRQREFEGELSKEVAQIMDELHWPISEGYYAHQVSDHVMATIQALEGSADRTEEQALNALLLKLPMKLRAEVKHALDGTKPEILRNG